MSSAHHHVLAYYVSTEFAHDYRSRARHSHQAVYTQLRVIVDQLMEDFRALRHPHPVAEPTPLSMFLAGPLSIEQLLALVRTYASRIALHPSL
jgi:hypothetical protein